jgi:hypothetical protein
VKLSDFHQLHRGQICLIVGLGPNLNLTPPHWFDYPSFGVNTIYKSVALGKWDGWKPTYFVGVDHRLEVEDGAAISDVYRDVPKFIPWPDRDSWQGENFFRFYHRPGDLLIGGQLPSDPKALTVHGIGYRKIMDAVLQIAWHMGFTTMLMIGVQHKPDDQQAHFWGADVKSIPEPTFHYWFDGYAQIIRAMGSKIHVVNISEDTYVPEDVIPRDDWRKYAKSEILAGLPG